MINSLSLPGYQLVDSDEQNEDIHFRLEAPTPVACEGCGVQGEFVRFGKRDVPYRDLPIHGKRVTLWVVRRRYTCRACKTTFRPQLPEMVDGFRMTLRLHEYVEKESFNHPYTFVAAQTGLDADGRSAVAAWQLLVDRDPNRARWQLQLGNAAALIDDVEMARRAWERAVALGQQQAAQLLEALP